MRDALRGVVIGLALLALGGAIASRAGWIATDLPRSATTGAWLLSRATGVTAFFALGLDVIAGLLISTRLADRWVPRAHVIDLHGWLSPIGIGLVLGHALVLLADGYIRFDLIDVAVPFAAAYRPPAVGLGVIAAYLAVVVHASFALRRRLGTKLWRRLHYLSFAAFGAAAVHAVLAGSDAGRPWAIGLYAAPLAIIGVLLAVRLRGIGPRSRGRAPVMDTTRAGARRPG